MNTLSLAVRNLLRNRRRSITTLLALAIGSTSVLTFGGYSADIRNTLLTDYVQTGGHIQIQHKDFFLFGFDFRKLNWPFSFEIVTQHFCSTL